MNGKLFSSFLGALTLLFSSTSAAHLTSSGDGASGIISHFLAGPDHLPMLILIGIGFAYFIRKRRRQDD